MIDYNLILNTLPSRVNYTKNNLNYKGEYDIMSGYKVGDIVRVIPYKEYKYPMTQKYKWIYDDLKINIINGVFVLKSGITPQVNILNMIPDAGVWVCVSDIPSMYNFLHLYNLNILPDDLKYYSIVSNGVKLDVDTANRYGSFNTNEELLKRFYKYIRLMDVNYYPNFKNLDYDDIAYLNVNDLTKAKGTYWKLLSLLPLEFTISKNGKKEINYMDSCFETGSYTQI